MKFPTKLNMNTFGKRTLFGIIYVAFWLIYLFVLRQNYKPILIFIFPLIILFEWKQISQFGFSKMALSLLVFFILFYILQHFFYLNNSIYLIVYLLSILLVFFNKKSRYGTLYFIPYVFTPFSLFLILDVQTCFFILLALWFNDTSAYLIGKKWGKTLLFPKLSKGKTLEGFLGSFFGIAILLITIYFIWNVRLEGYWHLALVPILSLMGDLFQSSIKREYNVKDSGRILPGHGGIWDRLDSFLFAIPFLFLIISFL